LLRSKSYEAHYLIFSSLLLFYPPFGPNILPSTLFSNSLNLYASLNFREHVSHPYKTTGKIIVLYILIFMFSDSRREDKRFDMNGSKHYLNVIRP
jgi:hypothetical protein